MVVGWGVSFHRKVFCMKFQVLCSWENTKHINDLLSANVIISERRVKKFLLFCYSCYQKLICIVNLSILAC